MPPKKSPEPESDPAVLGLFTEAERQAIWEQVDFWLSDAPEVDPKIPVQHLGRWLERHALFLAVVNSKLATGEKVIPGAAGAALMGRAIKDWPEYAASVLRVLRQKEEKPEEKD